MGSIKITHSFIESQWLHSQVQAIAGEIKTTDISPRKHQTLSRRLDTAFETLERLETKNKTADLFVKTQTEYLKNQFVNLYNELDNALLHREITHIQIASSALEKGEITPHSVKRLEKRINTLMKNHAPSLEQHRVLAKAKKTLSEAKLKLSGKEVPNHIEWLAQQRNVQFLESNPILPGEIEELFDIAKDVYDHDLRKAKTRYNQLPEEQKRSIQNHMRALGAELFDAKTETMQALIAAANDLAGNGQLYPDLEEIEDLFVGLSQVNAVESKEDKVFSFEPRLISGG